MAKTKKKFEVDEVKIEKVENGFLVIEEDNSGDDYETRKYVCVGMKEVIDRVTKSIK